MNIACVGFKKNLKQKVGGEKASGAAASRAGLCAPFFFLLRSLVCSFAVCAIVLLYTKEETVLFGYTSVIFLCVYSSVYLSVNSHSHSPH